MSYQITDSNGVTHLRPDHSKMIRIVKDMYDDGKDDFAEATMTHSSGIAISLCSNGTAVLDEPDEDTFSILQDLTFEDHLMLWVQMAAGNLKSLQKLDWSKQGIR